MGAAGNYINSNTKNINWGKELQDKAKEWRDQIAIKGWDYPPGEGPIMSIIIGSDNGNSSLSKP